jgi:prepilin-type N-terminal cleavage/methylation domain-containing protein
MNRTPIRSAFTLVEIMIAMVVLAILMTGIATVFQTTTQGFEENRKVSAATHAGRSVTDRITRHLRTASDASFNDTLHALTITDPDDGDGLSSVTYTLDGTKLRYNLDYSDGSPSAQAYLLGDGDDVTVSAFDATVTRDANGQPASIVSVVLTFSVIDRPYTFRASASLRRNAD